MDSEGNEEVTVTRSQDHKTSHDLDGEQELTGGCIMSSNVHR